jgi:2-keto-4-pentenoate hydratase/2-oxohepta-3-ene-1,7-dioic acid hydratase in catechol pathway
MKLARIEHRGRPTSAVGHGDGWIPLADLGLADDTVSSDAVAGVADALSKRSTDELATLTVTVDRTALRQPLSRVGKIICIGLNYRDHIAEIGAEAPAVPLVFSKFDTALNDPYGDIPVPGSETAQLDYEVELTLVIGRTGRDIAPQKVRNHISGYAVANDVSSRDVQFAEGQWVRSKSFDGFCPVGPWITTADEVDDPQALDLTTEVNGETRQNSNTGQLLFGIDEIVSFVSRSITLHPGDIILTGTPPGVAMGEEKPRWLQRGDVVRCAVAGLGEVENRIA